MKHALVNQLIAILEDEFTTLKQAVDSAEEAATHAEAKPENKYDTRGLEASYLAGAQKERLKELMASLAAVKSMPIRAFSDETPIGPSALVEYQTDDQTSLCFVTPAGAGYRLSYDNRIAVTITIHSPLGRALIGKRVGDVVTLGTGTAERDYEVLSVE